MLKVVEVVLKVAEVAPKAVGNCAEGAWRL